ncbi:MAG: thioredoxin-dependent thiol peroxidase [Spirochaetota bacterium]
MLQVGDTAPEFTLSNEAGETVSLSDYAGKKVVVYFYPKDDTSGCTKEACSFRDNHDRFLEKGAVVIGISADTEESHAKFKSKYDLPFYLLADPERKAISAFGAWGEKKMYGKAYEGIIRSTFVVDESGTIVKAWPKVKPDEHADEVLAVL